MAPSAGRAGASTARTSASTAKLLRRRAAGHRQLRGWSHLVLLGIGNIFIYDLTKNILILNLKSTVLSFACSQDAEFASVGEENVEDCADGKYDNQDEVEEADGLQHLREAHH